MPRREDSRARRKPSALLCAGQPVRIASLSENTEGKVVLTLEAS